MNNGYIVRFAITINALCSSISYHHSSSCIRQRSIHAVRMARDPSNISRAPINIIRLVVKHQLERGRRVKQVSSCRVQHTLRLARRSASVQHKERIFRLHPFGIARRVSALHFVMPPEIAIVDPFECGLVGGWWGCRCLTGSDSFQMGHDNAFLDNVTEFSGLDDALVADGF